MQRNQSLYSTLKIFLIFVVLVIFQAVALAEEPLAPPEITNLRFEPDKETLVWDSLSTTEGYHVYRGLLSDLPAGNYGECFEGSIQGTSTTDSEEPSIPGECFTYLISGFDEEGEGSLGKASSLDPRYASLSCIPARRFFDLTTNGDPGDGVLDGEQPRQNPNAMLWIFQREMTGVYLHTGEFFYSAVDLEILGRGFGSNLNQGSQGLEVPTTVPAGQNVSVSIGGGLRFDRSYRSQVSYNGPYGHGWDTRSNARLEPLGVDVQYCDGTARCDQFAREDATHFTSPVGLYADLIENPDGSFTLRNPEGTLLNFHAFDGSNLEGALETLEDRNGNLITLLYDHQGLLSTLVDTMGRPITFGYDALGRMTTLTDYEGRSVVYSYDTNDDLISVRSPVVTGTPNGNDFPDGKTTTYTYSSGFAEEFLNHNLLSIIPPNEKTSATPALENTYETSVIGFGTDRVTSQYIGGTNASGIPAGGTLTYSYNHLNDYGDPTDPTLARREATVIDRNGNQIDCIHNYLGNLLSLTEYTNRELRPGEIDYTTTYSYNDDGEILEIHPPEGNQTLFTYDSPGADRYREGNVLEKRIVADTVSSGGRGDGRGAEINDIVWTYTYEPVFNNIATIIDPRGNDTSYIPQNGGSHSAERYTTSWTYDYQEGDPDLNGINDLASRFGIDLGTTSFYLGDLNNDSNTTQAVGNAVRLEDPTVTLDASSHQAAIQGDTSQEIVTLYQYNDLGQITGIIDPEENKHVYTYYPETDPDGDGIETDPPHDGRILNTSTGGYLESRQLDTVSGAGRNNGTDPTPVNYYENYTYDPVGNRISYDCARGIRTKYTYNELNQIVQVRRSASTADASGPDGTPATGRGETGLTPYGYLIRYEYDADDNLVKKQLEDNGETRGLGPYVDRLYTYDLLDNLVEMQEEVTGTNTISTGYRYDANENLIQLIQPIGNTHEWAYDERDLLLSTTLGASGPRGGTASTSSYEYDGNGNLKKFTDGNLYYTNYTYDGLDRRIRTEENIGNTYDRYYDPASKITRELRQGPVDGSSSTNVDLADTEYFYDEMNRLIRYDRELFVPTGASPYRTPILDEGSLVPSDGYINTIYEYDRLSRNSFHTKDSGTITRYEYDGLNRLIKLEDAGSNTMEYTYDDNSNLIEVIDTDISSSSGPPSEQFFTTYFYDSLDRRVRVVDNAGQTWDYIYDSLDSPTTSTDPNGPTGGTINRRSPGHEGDSVEINSYGNVTNYTYDGLDRRIRTECSLTPTGKGDGTTTPTLDTSNTYNPDGLNTMITNWDDNSLIQDLTDDRGYITHYSYDNLNRRVRRTADDDTYKDWAYDANHNPVTITDANGSVLTNTFDSSNRLTQTSVSRATGIIGTTLQTYEYDGLNRLTKATDNNSDGTTDDSTVTFIYDSLSRIVEEGQKIEDGFGMKYSDNGWLAEDLQTDLIYPSGRHIVYGYDSADRLASVTDTVRTESATFEYYGMGRMHTRNYGNGIRSTLLNDAGDSNIGYDEVKRVILYRHLDTLNASLAAFEYSYDRASNRNSVRRLHYGDGMGNYMGELYALDSSNRLISFQEGMLNSDLIFTSPLSDSQQWTLDGVGNWPEMVRNGFNYLATPNNLNEYDEMQSGGTRVDDGIPDDFLDLYEEPPVANGMNLAHNKNGSQTNDGLYEIKYDFMDRPVEVVRLSDLQVVSNYSYDPLGRRITKNISSSLAENPTQRVFYASGILLDASDFRSEQSYFREKVKLMNRCIHGYGVVCGLEVKSKEIETRDETDSVDRQIVSGPGTNHLWQVRGDGSSHYYLEDALGSTAALADGGAPIVLERITYDAYGKPTIEDPTNVPIVDLEGKYIAESELGNPYLFRGMRYDPELSSRTDEPNTDLGGYYVVGSDYYNPDQGRYVARDYNESGNRTGSGSNPYNFGGGSPINDDYKIGGDWDLFESPDETEFLPFDLPNPFPGFYEFPEEEKEPSDEGLVMYWDEPPKPKPSIADIVKKAVEAVKRLISKLKNFKLSFIAINPNDQTGNIYNPGAVNTPMLPESENATDPRPFIINNYELEVIILESTPRAYSPIRNMNLGKALIDLVRDIPGVSGIDVTGYGYPGGSRGGNSGDRGLAPPGSTRSGHYSGGSHAGLGGGGGARSWQPKSPPPSAPPRFHLEDAFPVRWDIGSFSPSSNVACETIVCKMQRVELGH